MLIYLDQIADKKLKASSTEDATTITYSSSTASIRTAGGLSVEKRIMAGKFYGRVPLGAVVPVISTFTAPANGGGSPSDIDLLTPATGVITDDGFMRCDGSLINNILSPFNGRYTPDISDNRFIQGSITSTSLLSVSNGVNLGNNTVVLSINQMPSHNHGGGNHNHDYITPDRVNDTDRGEGPPSNWSIDTIQTYTTSNSGTIINSQGGGQSFDIRPKYISGIYLMRVI